MKKLLRKLSTTHIIMLGFLAVILVGSVLLVLPVSSKSGESVPYIDALFCATTATCVTGLVTLPTVSTWSTFGHIVILCLVQIGGLGVVTVMAGMMLILHRKMGLGDRLLIQDAFNLNTLSGLVRFVKKVLAGTFIVEGVGALLYMTVFVPKFGLYGIWVSVFNSVSAFCNAGIDIISENGLRDYATDPVVNIVTSLLVILGGLGYIVWWDIIRVARTKGRRRFRYLTLHTKIVLTATAVLLLGGTAAFFIFEYSNPMTLGGRPLPHKLLISFFQSMTTRSSGFATIPQQELTNPSLVVSMLFMFIGGSPVGTAGGIKTVTFAVLIASALAMVQNKTGVTMFGRELSSRAVNKAVAVTGVSFVIMFMSTVLLSVVTDASVIDVMYEALSATTTVGLTRNLTPRLNIMGKIIIMVTVYLGRIGPISLAVALNRKRESKNIIKYPTEDISVG